MSNNRVYYGEYSLAYWIQMILKGNIVLPEYQRTFVWNKDDYTNLIDSFKEKQFIPPVTIGAYKTTNGQDNLIIDGQQRLTSVFLAYIERFPKKEAGTYEDFELAIQVMDVIIDRGEYPQPLEVW